MRRPPSIKQERVSDEARKENIRPKESVTSVVDEPAVTQPPAAPASKKKADKKRKETVEESVVVTNNITTSIGADGGVRTSGDGAKKVKV